VTAAVLYDPAHAEALLPFAWTPARRRARP
jgi:hypothetical protein